MPEDQKRARLAALKIKVAAGSSDSSLIGLVGSYAAIRNYPPLNEMWVPCVIFALCVAVLFISFSIRTRALEKLIDIGRYYQTLEDTKKEQEIRSEKGQELLVGPQVARYCHSCGTRLALTDHFCSYCGIPSNDKPLGKILS